MTSDQFISAIHSLTSERTAAGRACAWSDVVALDRKIGALRLALLKQRKEEFDSRLVSIDRRQKRQCVGCGESVCKVVLCDTCRKTLAFCPNCGIVYPRRASLPARCSSEHCRPCVTLLAQGRRGGGTREAYNERRQERRQQLLPLIIERRYAGDTFEQIGAALSLTDVQVAVLIRDARKRGEWPRELRRQSSDR